MAAEWNKFDILFVEDEQEILDLFCHALSGESFVGDVTCVPSAEDAQLIVSERGFGRPFAVALIDLVIPGKVSAIDLAHYIRRVTPDTIIVAFTGYPDRLFSQAVLEVPFDDFLLKPLPSEKLRQSVWSYCSRFVRRRRLTECLERKETCYRDALDRLREIEYQTRLMLLELGLYKNIEEAKGEGG